MIAPKATKCSSVTGAHMSLGVSMARTEKSNRTKEPELLPDAWPRFEQFVKAIAKAGPQHRTPAGKAKAKPGGSPKPKRKPRRSRRGNDFFGDSCSANPYQRKVRPVFFRTVGTTNAAVGD